MQVNAWGVASGQERQPTQELHHFHAPLENKCKTTRIEYSEPILHVATYQLVDQATGPQLPASVWDVPLELESSTFFENSGKMKPFMFFNDSKIPEQRFSPISFGAGHDAQLPSMPHEKSVSETQPSHRAEV